MLTTNPWERVSVYVCFHNKSLERVYVISQSRAGQESSFSELVVPVFKANGIARTSSFRPLSPEWVFGTVPAVWCDLDAPRRTACHPCPRDSWEVRTTSNILTVLVLDGSFLLDGYWVLDLEVRLRALPPLHGETVPSIVWPFCSPPS